VSNRPAQAHDLADRMKELANEIIDPYICRDPAYGAPGYAHCAACCSGTGLVITCDEDQTMVDAAMALEKAAAMLKGVAADPSNRAVVALVELQNAMADMPIKLPATTRYRTMADLVANHFDTLAKAIGEYDSYREDHAE
jgi:hypothetical protein